MSSQTGASPLVSPQEERRQRHVLRRFMRNRAAVFGLIGFAVIVLVAIAAPLLATNDPVRQSLRQALQPPSMTHYLGTDQFGRDIYSRLVFGARISLRVGIISVGIALLLGAPLGL